MPNVKVKKEGVLQGHSERGEEEELTVDEVVEPSPCKDEKAEHHAQVAPNVAEDKIEIIDSDEEELFKRGVFKACRCGKRFGV